MTPQRWTSVKRILLAALELESDARDAYLDRACPGDEALRDEVASLLGDYDVHDGFLTSLPRRMVPTARIDPTSLVGQRVSHYEIQSPIHCGVTGAVFKAFDLKLHRDVALKMVTPRSSSRTDAASPEAEAKVLASLNHPNIAQIYSFEAALGHDFLVLELVEGPTLAARIERRALTLDLARVILSSVASALHAAHETGIIHRDLKPQNIAMNAKGEVKVLDFGIASRLEVDDVPEEEATPRLPARTPTIVGTASYMSPEQTRGSDLDPRSDIWAFGCVLFESLTRTKAFDGATVLETIAAVQYAPPDLDSLPRRTPRAMASLISDCLQKEPDDRPESMMAVRDRLRKRKWWSR